MFICPTYLDDGPRVTKARHERRDEGIFVSCESVGFQNKCVIEICYFRGFDFCRRRPFLRDTLMETAIKI